MATFKSENARLFGIAAAVDLYNTNIAPDEVEPEASLQLDQAGNVVYDGPGANLPIKYTTRNPSSK